MPRRRLGETAVSIKGIIFGREGTRKSNTAIQIATLKKRDGEPMKVLLLDLEYKAIEGYNEGWLENKGVDFNNVCEIRTRDLPLIVTILEKFTKGQPIPLLDENDNIVEGKYELDINGNPFIADAVVVDSLSIIQELLAEGRGEIITKRANIKATQNGLFGDAKDVYMDNASMLTQLDYAKLKTKALKIIRDLQAVTGRHVFFTVKAKDAKQSELVNGKVETIDLGYEIMDATSFKFLPYEVSLVIHTYKDKNDNIIYRLDKDTTGVKEQYKEYLDFSLKDYEEFINNSNRKKILKVKSYSEDLEKAKNFADEAEEPTDLKLKMYNLIVGVCKTDKEKATEVIKYCKERGLNLSTPDLVSVDDLCEMKKIVEK